LRPTHGYTEQPGQSLCPKQLGPVPHPFGDAAQALPTLRASIYFLGVNMKLAITAGHGANDPGAVYNGNTEQG
jgi:N-acetylmuramoyl-L-alanine amidase